MTVLTNAGAALAQAVERLRARLPGDSASAAALDAQLLLAHALGITRERLLSHPELALDAAASIRYGALIGRRTAGEPLAYLTGQREFWSLDLSVTPAVLVPRPETELLVERALVLGSAAAQVADLGTGSGAIALAIARERPDWRITATDVSAEALVVARTNAASLGLRQVEFLEGSWFEPLAGRCFDLVVSNPPYVAADDPAMTSGALAYEPRLALTPGADAMACLRAIAHAAPRYLARGGWLLLEHGATQGEALRHELVAAGFTHVRSHTDLAGHERMTEGQR